MSYREAIIDVVESSRKKLGARTLENGVELVGHVPHVGPEAWLHALFPGLRKAQLRDLESRLGRRLPTVLSDFFTWKNGVDLFSTSLSIYGLRTSYDRKGDEIWQPFDIVDPNTLERPGDASTNDIFIGGYDWDGSLLYIDENEQVFRCSRDSRRPLNHWSSLDEMFTAECSRLAGLFDEKGREIDPKYPKTPPSIGRARGAARRK